MKDKKEYFDKIDDYILGHLSGEEERAFVKELETNTALTKALDSQKRIRQGMLEAGRVEMRAEFKAIHQKVVTSNPEEAPARKIPWRPLIAAASVLFISFLAWWLWSPQNHTPQQIFANHYKPFKLMLAMRDEDSNQQIVEAADLYRKGKYAEALPLLDSMALVPKDHSQLLLALAIARFENKDFTNAFSPLNQIIQSNDPFLSDQARWYSALFYLQMNQVESAIPFLQKIAASPNAGKRQEAQKILTLLK